MSVVLLFVRAALIPSNFLREKIGSPCRVKPEILPVFDMIAVTSYSTWVCGEKMKEIMFY